MPTVVNKQRIVLISVLVVTSALLLAERLTSIEINSNVVLFLLVFTLVGNLSLIVSQYLFGALSKRYVTFLLLIVFSACLSVAVLTWADNWKTQAVLYRSKKHPRQTIEYRMRSKYGYGYEKQLVSKNKILGFINAVRIADTTELDKSKWIKVDEMVNEMGFPGDYIIGR